MRRDDREPIPAERPLLNLINPNLQWPLLNPQGLTINDCPSCLEGDIEPSLRNMWWVSLTWQQCTTSCSWSWWAGCPACGAGCCSCQVCALQTLGTVLCLQEDDKRHDPDERLWWVIRAVVALAVKRILAPQGFAQHWFAHVTIKYRLQRGPLQWN